MKIRAKANGNIVDVSDGEGEALLLTGIYELMTKPKPVVRKAPPAKPKAPVKPTKVGPLTTEDVPTPMKKAT